MLLIGTAALLFFGPDQLPKVARRAGQAVRDVQATSASFIREMERAADEPPAHSAHVREPYEAHPAYGPQPFSEAAPREPAPDPIITTTSQPKPPQDPEPPRVT